MKATGWMIAACLACLVSACSDDDEDESQAGAHNYVNNPVKTVHFVADSRALTGKVEKAGLPILSQPNIFDVMGTKALIGLARDPDGYTVEMVTTQ